MAWDPTGRYALTLTSDDRLLGLSFDEDVFEAQARVSPTLVWDPEAPLLTILGDRLLVDGTGRVGVDGEHGTLALAADHSLLAIHRADGSLSVVQPDGSEIFRTTADVVEWSPVGASLLLVDGTGVVMIENGHRRVVLADPEDRGQLSARWSPAGASIVVWGAVGPFEVRDRGGDPLASFPAHHGRVNLAAAIGTTVLVTSGDDHWLSLHDPLAGMTVGRVDLPSPAVWLEISPGDEMLMAESLDGTVGVHRLPSLEAVGPRRPATRASWSPIGPGLACCDDQDLWLEDWS